MYTMNLDHVNYSFVDNVTQIPVYTGDCLYVCDLDDTLLKQYYIFNKKGIKLSSGKTIYRREVTGLHHPDIPQWMFPDLIAGHNAYTEEGIHIYRLRSGSAAH